MTDAECRLIYENAESAVSRPLLSHGKWVFARRGSLPLRIRRHVCMIHARTEDVPAGFQFPEGM